MVILFPQKRLKEKPPQSSQSRENSWKGQFRRGGGDLEVRNRGAWACSGRECPQSYPDEETVELKPHLSQAPKVIVR